MPEYDNTNRWAIFKNDRKQGDRSPDYTGSLNVEGKEYFINGWVKEGAKGKFFSGSIKPKDPREDNERPRGRMTVTSGRQSIPLDDEDDIPF